MLSLMPAPLGTMIAGATVDGLAMLEFTDRRGMDGQMQSRRARTERTLLTGRTAIHERLGVELIEYFNGEREHFETPLLVSGTPFQVSVWDALPAIPFGETRSYAEQAAHVGNPEAVRAVARANGANRIAILIPCHRVIGADGKLTGYGGGLWRKRRLLDLEAGRLRL